jgi:hypothetical protein
MFSITDDIVSGCTGSQAEPVNPDSEALPPIFVVEERGRASGHRSGHPFPGRAGEPVKSEAEPLDIRSQAEPGNQSRTGIDTTQDYVDSLKLLFDCQHF